MREIRSAFREAGLRQTRQREAIYAALCGTTAHPTADELFEMVREREPGLSLATVYNSLEALTEVGLCQRLTAAGGPCRYDADVSRHVHLVLHDGRVLDVPDSLADQILRGLPSDLCDRLGSESGTAIDSLSIQLVASEPAPTCKS